MVGVGSGECRGNRSQIDFGEGARGNDLFAALRRA